MNETVRECDVSNGESYAFGSYIVVFWCYFLLKTLYTFLINVMYNTSDALGSSIAKLENGKYASMVFFADIAMALAPLITGQPKHKKMTFLSIFFSYSLKVL